MWFKYQTIWRSGNFWPFEYQTSPVLKLYLSSFEMGLPFEYWNSPAFESPTFEKALKNLSYFESLKFDQFYELAAFKY